MAASHTPRTFATFATGTAGTAIALGTKQRLSAMTLIARDGNKARVYIAGSDVTTTVNDGLRAGAVLEYQFTPQHPDDLANFFIAVDTTGEGVDIYGLKV